MPGHSPASVFIGNLDEKVDERILYEILIQAGPVVDVYMPRDKETKRHKGYAFAEFPTESSAQYAVDLFSGLVYLHKKPIRFSISGQDKVVQRAAFPDPRDDKNDLLSCGSRNFQKSHMPAFSPRAGHSDSRVVGHAVTECHRVQVHSSYVDAGQRLDFSPPAYVQGYSSRLVSLGQAGIQSQLHNVGLTLPYRFH